MTDVRVGLGVGTITPLQHSVVVAFVLCPHIRSHGTAAICKYKIRRPMIPTEVVDFRSVTVNGNAHNRYDPLVVADLLLVENFDHGVSAS